jgi:indole-3-glycerol-phosphate lyase
LATTAEALRVLEHCGADVIELGVPSSDPYVDGPTIQASSARALAGGTTMDSVLAMLKEVTPELSCPVVLFSYYKPITLCRGGLTQIKDAGVHGR